MVVAVVKMVVAVGGLVGEMVVKMVVPVGG